MIKKNILDKAKLAFLTKALFLLWLLLHIALLIISFSQGSIQSVFALFPFNYKSQPGLWAYDITEFIGYSCVIPYLVWTSIKRKISSSRRIAIFTPLCIAYCDFLLAFMLFSDNYDVAFFLLSIIWGLLIFLLARYVVEMIFSIFRP